MFLIESISLKNQTLMILARNFAPTKTDPTPDVGFEIFDHKNNSLGVFGVRLSDLDNSNILGLQVLDNQFGVKFAFPDKIKEISIAILNSEYHGDVLISSDYTSKFRQVLPGYRLIVSDLALT